MSQAPILLDMEVQRDFFAPGGSCYTRDASRVAARIYSLFAWAASGWIPVVSTVLRLRRIDLPPLAATAHCVEGTDGERKMTGTVLNSRINLGLRNVTDLPDDLLDEYQQVIFEKRDTDIFLHARAERFVTQLPHRTFVVCGAGLARGVAQAVIGLRNRGFPVIVADDAVLDLGDPLASMARLRMEAKGAIFLPTHRIVEVSGPQRRAGLRRLRRPAVSFRR